MKINEKWFTYSENGLPIGVVCLNLTTKEILCLLVDSEYRNKGIATKLIKQVEDFAKLNKISSIHATAVQSNVASNALFKKLGYVKLIKWEKKILRKF